MIVLISVAVGKKEALVGLGIGRNLAKARGAARLSAVALATEMTARGRRVSDRTIQRWEADDGAPDLLEAAVMAEILGVTLTQLATGRDDVAALERRVERLEDERRDRGVGA